MTSHAKSTTGAGAGDTDVTTTAPATPASSPLRVNDSPPIGLADRRYGLHTREEVEQRYVAARDAWTMAMKAANSGRAADLAALAIAQESFEAAAAERERWESGAARVAIPIEPERSRADLGAVVGQELAWRKVKTIDDRPTGPFGRIRRLFRGRQADR